MIFSRQKISLGLQTWNSPFWQFLYDTEKIILIFVKVFQSVSENIDCDGCQKIILNSIISAYNQEIRFTEALSGHL